MGMFDHAVFCFQFKAQNHKYLGYELFLSFSKIFYCMQVKDLFFLLIKYSVDVTKIRLIMAKELFICTRL